MHLNQRLFTHKCDLLQHLDIQYVGLLKDSFQNNTARTVASGDCLQTPESKALWRSPHSCWSSLAEMPVRAVTTRFMYKGLCTIPDVLSYRTPVNLPEDEVEGQYALGYLLVNGL